MSLTYLKSRTHRILEAVIQSYVESALPVGSEFLVQHYRFGVSPATIRNVMAELETQELITHPHTSAGRIPTDRGYRYYADVLMEPKKLKAEEEERLEGLGRTKVDEPLEFLEAAAELLAELTQEAAVVLVPQWTQGTLRRLTLISVDPRELVGVLIASEGLIRHAVLELSEPVEEEEIDRIERFLNQELVGMPLSRVHTYLERALLETTGAFFHMYKRASRLLSFQPFFEEETSLILEGTSSILEAPEFRDIRRTRRLLKALEERNDLAELLRRDLAADGVKFHIGSENKGTSLTDCTLAAAPYRMKGGVMGALGVLGPTRMDYPRVSSLISKMAQSVTRAFQE